MSDYWEDEVRPVCPILQASMIPASATGEMSLRNLNEDVTGALNFMVSNKLVANPNIGLYSSQDLTSICSSRAQGR